MFTQGRHGVQTIRTGGDEWNQEKIEIGDLKKLHGFYFKGPAVISLSVKGKHSRADIEMTAEVAHELIDILRALIEGDAP